jgi:hypothetical protein
MSMLSSILESAVLNDIDRTDEPDENTVFIGVLKPSTGGWFIKKITQVGSERLFQYPNGQRDFLHSWDDRLNYTYMDKKS